MVNPFFAAHAKPIIKKQPMSSNIIKTPTGVRRTNPLAPGPAEYTKSLHSALNNNSNFPDEAPVKENIGKIGLMWPERKLWNTMLRHSSSSTQARDTQWSADQIGQTNI
jgi:hypothetical protein